MANRFFGETSVAIAGKTYVLRLDINAMCDFEDVTGKEAMTVLEQLEKGKANTKDLRAMFWCCLKGHQPDVTIEEAGALQSQNLDALTAVLQAAMPTDDEAPQKGKPRRPAKQG
jgi:hypothetical protein